MFSCVVMARVIPNKETDFVLKVLLDQQQEIKLELEPRFRQLSREHGCQSINSGTTKVSTSESHMAALKFRVYRHQWHKCWSFISVSNRKRGTMRWWAGKGSKRGGGTNRWVTRRDRRREGEILSSEGELDYRDGSWIRWKLDQGPHNPKSIEEY